MTKKKVVAKLKEKVYKRIEKPARPQRRFSDVLRGRDGGALFAVVTPRKARYSHKRKKKKRFFNLCVGSCQSVLGEDTDPRITPNGRYSLDVCMDSI